MRVTAVTSGYYGGVYHPPGDVFDVASPDYSDSTVNYGPGSATKQFGWMLIVAANTPLLTAQAIQAPPLFPIVDPVPPRRFVY